MGKADLLASKVTMSDLAPTSSSFLLSVLCRCLSAPLGTAVQ
jgi:hypothetical protein